MVSDSKIINPGNPHHFVLENVDFVKFVETLDQCKDQIILITDEGDRFNLRSKFSQMVGFFSLIKGGKLTHAKIYCKNSDDETLLFRFGLFGD